MKSYDYLANIRVLGLAKEWKHPATCRKIVRQSREVRDCWLQRGLSHRDSRKKNTGKYQDVDVWIMVERGITEEYSGLTIGLSVQNGDVHQRNVRS